MLALKAALSFWISMVIFSMHSQPCLPSDPSKDIRIFRDVSFVAHSLMVPKEELRAKGTALKEPPLRANTRAPSA